MTFVISRASDSSGNTQPCIGARLVVGETRSKVGEVIDETDRPVTLELIRQYPSWVISINSLEELIALSNELNYPLIVSARVITIYDDYIE